MRIFVARFGRSYGPYTRKVVDKYLGDGSLSGNDLAWSEGWAEWVPLTVLVGGQAWEDSVADQRLRGIDGDEHADVPQAEGQSLPAVVVEETNHSDLDSLKVLTGEKLKADLSGRFAKRKCQFLIDLEVDLKKRIRARGKQSLAIIEMQSAGTRSFPPSTSLEYCKRLIAFVRKKKFDGNEVDVELTGHVVEIVTEHFESLYLGDEEGIAEAVTQAILKDEVAAKLFVEAVLETSTVTNASEAVKQQVAGLVLSQLRSALHGASIKSILISAAKYAAAKPAGVVVLRTLALNMKVVVAKILASATLKATIAGAIKKFLLAAIIGYVVRVVGVKLGIATLASKTGVLIPIVIGFVAWEIHRFPKNLSVSVAKKVVQELDDKYEKVHAEIVDRLVVEIFSSGLNAIARDLGRSDAVQRELESLFSGKKP